MNRKILYLFANRVFIQYTYSKQNYITITQNIHSCQKLEKKKKIKFFSFLSNLL